MSAISMPGLNELWRNVAPELNHILVDVVGPMLIMCNQGGSQDDIRLFM